MRKLTFVAHLKSPLISRGYLTFDALLGALLFERLGDPDKAHASIPLVQTEGLFHASSAIFEPHERRPVTFTASLRARHDLSDHLFKKNGAGTKLHRTLGETRRRDFGNVLSTYEAVETSTVVWHCEGDLDAIAELLADADFIGKKRTAGFGQISGWDFQEGDSDGLVGENGKPLRPIPVHLFNGDDSLPVQDAAWRPAYWDPRNRAPCFAPPLSHR